MKFLTLIFVLTAIACITAAPLASSGEQQQPGDASPEQQTEVAAASEKSNGNGIELISQQLASDLRAAVQDIRDTLKEEIASLKSLAKRLILQGVEASVSLLNDGAVQFEHSLVSLVNQFNSQITAPAQRGQNYWNDWSDKQLNRFNERVGDNDEATEQAEQLVDNFLQRYAEESNDCAAPLQEQTDQFDADAADVLSQYQEALQNLEEQVSACLANDDGFKANAECSLNVHEALKELSPLKLKQLSRRGALLKEQVSTALCVARLRIEAERESRKVKQQLEQLAADANESDSGNDSGSEAGDGASDSDNDSDSANDSADSNNDSSDSASSDSADSSDESSSSDDSSDSSSEN